MNEAQRALFEAWLVDMRKGLRAPGVMTNAEEYLLWYAFLEGWRKAEIELGRKELKSMQHRPTCERVTHPNSLHPCNCKT